VATNLRFDIAFDADTKKAAAQVGSFAREMRRDITAAVKALPDIELKANQGDAHRKIALIRNELERLSSKTVGVDIDEVAARQQITRLRGELQALERTAPTVQVRADVTSALAALKTFGGEADRLDGRKVTVNVDVDRKSIGDSIRDLGSLASSLKSLAMPAALLTAAPKIASLGSAAVQAAGALYLLPAAGLAAAAAIGTLVVGMQGFGEAMKNRDDPEKFAAALKDLAPAARVTAVEVQKLGPAWKSMQLDVQQKLFAGLSTEIRLLSNAYLPVLRTGLGGIAVELNAGAKNFSAWAREAATVRDTATIFTNIRATMHELVPAGTNVAAALKDIAVVGSVALPELASGFTSVTARFREFIAEARQSGQLAVWIENGITKIAQLGSIARNVGQILGSIFSAADASGAGFLDTLDAVTTQIRDFLTSAQGQQIMVDVFTTIGQAVRVVGEALATAGQVLGPFVSMLANLAQGALSVMDALGPLPGILLAGVVAWKAFGVAAAVVTGLGTKLAVVGSAAGLMAGQMGASAGTANTLAGAGAKAEGVFSRLGKTLPLVGLALVGADTAASAAVPDFDALAQSVIRGELAMSTLGKQVQEGQSGWSEFMGTMFPVIDVMNQSGTATAAVGEKVDELRAKMSPLQLAQSDVARAQTEYNAAVKEFGANSPQAITAQDALAAAAGRVKVAEDEAKSAMQSTTAALLEMQNQMLASIDADIAAEQALLRVKDAQKAYNDAVREHGPTSTQAQAAANAYNQSILQAITAAGQAAVKQAELSGQTDTAAAALAAQNSTALTLAGSMNGPLPVALQKIIGGMDQTQLAAAGATVKIDATGQAVVTLPNGKTVAILADHVSALRNIGQVREQLLILANGVTVPIYTSVQGGSISRGGVASAGRLAGGGVVYPVRAAQGLVVNGYAPGRDTVPAMLSPGEAVLVPELVRKIGPGNILAANAAASGRQGAVFAPVRGFAAGGLTRPGMAASTGTAAADTGGAVGAQGLDGLEKGAQASGVAIQALIDNALVPLDENLRQQVAPALQQVAELAAGTTSQSIVALTSTLPPLLEQFVAAGMSGQVTWRQIAAAVQASVAQQTGQQQQLMAGLGLLDQQNINTAGVAGQSWAQAQAAVAGSVAGQQGQFGVLQGGLSQVNTANTNTAGVTGQSWAQGQAAVAASVAGQQGQFGALQGGLGQVNTAMANTASSTATSFGQVRANTGDPIRWVLQQPFNAGLIAAWNRINDFFALGKAMGPVPVGFAFGGRVGGTGTGDTVPAMLEPGEFVVSKDAAQSVGLDTLDRWHRAVRGSTGDGGWGVAETERARRAQFAALNSGRLVEGAEHTGPGISSVGFGGVKPHVARAGHYLGQRFGIRSIGGVGARPGPSDHPRGLALDFMTYADTGKGNALVNYLVPNAGHFGVKYIIWQQRINEGGGWKGMANRGSPTANHMDHPHVSFLDGPGGGGGFSGEGGGFGFDPKAYVENEFKAAGEMARSVVGRFGGGNPPLGGQGDATLSVDESIKAAIKMLTTATTFDQGGILAPGQVGVNLSGRPERVLSPDETRGRDRLWDAMSTRRGAGAGSPSSVELSVSGVEAKLDKLNSTLERKPGGGNTFNITGQDPSETARATVFQLRMAR